MVAWMEKVGSISKKEVSKSDACHPELKKEENKPDACEDGLPDRTEGQYQGERPGYKHERLFTEAELDPLERGEYVLASVEPEEYKKELEERLFPLAEEELRLRVKENADGQKEPSIEELSKRLEIPAEVLERTEEVAMGALSTPEYWQEWYGKKIAEVEDAKRAHRNFKGSEESRASSLVTSNTGRLQHHSGGVTESALLVAQGKGGAESVGQGQVQDVTAKQEAEVEASEKEATATEPQALRNVCVGLKNKDLEVPEEVGLEGDSSVSLQWRSVAR
ncbi:hypothetical protein PI125_g2099 [Phytophthora idaei]|nr:hypothetical protein PI125_g2099 [Phytophthora idaei]KAG3171411.1 hypothetical protein PI126_g1908 [Phytophthora idaei]